MKNKAEQISGSRAGLASDMRLHSGWGRHLLRLMLVSIGVILCGMLLGAIGLFFLFQGGALENEALNNRIERSITSFLGPQYNVSLGRTKIEFHGVSLISITSTKVKIHKTGKDSPVAVIGKVLVGVQPLSLIKGQPKIQTVTIESSKLDLKQFALGGTGIPVDINESLTRLGHNLERLQGRLAVSELKSISIKDSELIGFKPGKNSTGSMKVSDLMLTVSSPDELNMQLAADTGISKFTASADYSKQDYDERSLNIRFDDVDVREWAQDPTMPFVDDTFVASNSKARGRLYLSFNHDNSVQQPVLNIAIGKGDLRLGRKGNTNIGQIVLNFRVFPKLNRIIMERSQINVGGFRALVVGGVTPTDLKNGLAGDLDYTLVVERAQGSVSQTGEKVHPGSMILEGGFIQARKLLNIDQWKLAVAGGGMVGSASLGFDSVTPSLVLNGVSSGMPVAALKQFWPVFLATPVRKWVLDHVDGGRITSATIDASIPGGILGRLHRGSRIADDQLTMKVDVENVRFDTFAELPPVRTASGTMQVKGMRTLVNLDRGIAYVSDGEPVKLTEGMFLIPDISTRPLKVETSFVAVGPVASIARISNAKPLIVMDRLKMDPDQWSGNGEIDMVVKFPIKKNPAYHEISWQALVRLDNAKSSKLITGRSISKADVVIDISPDKAVITGDSTIDGIRGNVLMIEPVGKDSKVKRKRILKARMSAKERSSIGLVVEPVISGPLDVIMEQYEGRKAANITVDLKDAEIALPWIGWRKGVDIPARATFQMVNANNRTSITNLKLSGEGFSLNGDMVIDKKGVLSADIAKVSLNKDDDLAVRIRRDKGTYTITANGGYFDGRVLVNKMFHKKGIADEQGTATFKLSANIDRVKGFGGHFADKFILHYSVKDGWLDALSVNTRFGQSQLATIEANTEAETTSFIIRSENAGSSLSFLNLYTHMVDGIVVSDLKRKRNEPFFGDVLVENFIVVDEPKLKKLVSNQQLDEYDRGGRIKKEFSKIQTNRVRFLRAESTIDKGQGYLNLNGSLTGVQIGLTYNGTLYDSENRMDMSGTFMPAFGISRIVSAIPFVGQLLSNGKDSGLIGITYRLTGPAESPKIQINPLSVVAPGVFKKVFEPRRN